MKINKHSIVSCSTWWYFNLIISISDTNQWKQFLAHCVFKLSIKTLPWGNIIIHKFWILSIIVSQRQFYNLIPVKHDRKTTQVTISQYLYISLEFNNCDTCRQRMDNLSLYHWCRTIKWKSLGQIFQEDAHITLNLLIMSDYFWLCVQRTRTYQYHSVLA